MVPNAMLPQTKGCAPINLTLGQSGKELGNTSMEQAEINRSEVCGCQWVDLYPIRSECLVEDIQAARSCAIPLEGR